MQAGLVGLMVGPFLLHGAPTSRMASVLKFYMMKPSDGRPWGSKGILGDPQGSQGDPLGVALGPWSAQEVPGTPWGPGLPRRIKPVLLPPSKNIKHRTTSQTFHQDQLKTGTVGARPVMFGIETWDPIGDPRGSPRDPWGN